VDDDAESARRPRCASPARGLVERVSLKAVLCDVRINGMGGLDLLDQVWAESPVRSKR
jgi:hypothetical protein